MKAKNSSGVYFRPGKRGGSWWVDLLLDGRRIRRKVEAASKSEALRLRSIMLTDAMRGELRLPGRKKTIFFHDLCDKYLEHATLNLKGKGWVTVRAQLKRARTYFGNVPIHRITSADCAAYRDEIKRIYQQRAFRLATEGKLVRGEEPKFKPSTANHYLGTLKRLFSWAKERKLVENNPASEVKRHKPEAQPFHLVTPEEERRLLDAAEKSRARHLKSVITLALHTGARREEVTQLEWKQVDLDAELITLTETKNGKIRHIPLDDTALKLLTDLRSRTGGCRYVFDDGRGKASHLSNAWNTARQKAGVPGGLVFHSVRHTTASRLVMAGVDLTTVGEILGNPSAVKRYVHLTPEHLKAAIKKLDLVPDCHKYATSSEKGVVEKTA